MLPGPLQKEASVRLAAAVTTLLGGTAAPPPADFASLADAEEALPRVAAEACRAAGDAYASAMRLQVGGLNAPAGSLSAAAIAAASCRCCPACSACPQHAS